jgi:hypothetical protein
MRAPGKRGSTVTPSGERGDGNGHTGRFEAVYIDVGIWFDAVSGDLNMALGGPRNAHVTISASGASAHGHPELFRALGLVLRDAGAPHPLL